MTYSIDFRRKVLLICRKEGLTVEEVAKRFGVGKMSVVRWSKCLYPKEHRNRVSLKIDRDALKEDVRIYKDAYHYERAERLGVSPAGIYKALKRLGITFKKNSFSPQGLLRRTACFPGEDTNSSKGR